MHLSCRAAGCKEQETIGVHAAPLAEHLSRLHPATGDPLSGF